MSGKTLEQEQDERLPGFFGKVPSHGDFVSRRLPGNFVESWDRWLQESVSQSRSQLEDRWLDCYLTSPVWRFALSSGVCGEGGWAGVVMPSVDKVGRYFPMTLAARMGTGRCPVQAMESLSSWYDQIEQLALSCLTDDFDLEAFDEGLKTLGPPIVEDNHADTPSDCSRDDGEHVKCWRLGVSLATNPFDVCGQILRHSLNELFARHSLWWTEGSSLVQPSFLVCEGLPPMASFAALLDGAWSAWGWRDKGPENVPTAAQGESSQEQAPDHPQHPTGC